MPKLNKDTLAWEEEPVAPIAGEPDIYVRNDAEREEAFLVAVLNTLWCLSRELRDIADAIRERKR